MTTTTTTKELAKEILPYIRVYTDGSVDRLNTSPIVPPPSPDSGVLAKDITISQEPLIRARLYLTKPTNIDHESKLPILVYFHGGGFCFDSAFSLTETTYLTRLASSGKMVCVAVEYRLAPEYPLPAGYEDGWYALKWVVNHFSNRDLDYKEPWIFDHADFLRLYIGGDSAGGNLVHNTLIRAGQENLPGDVKILGAYMSHPYFWGSSPIGNEPKTEREKLIPHDMWNLVYPNAEDGVDNLMINPVAPGAPSLARLGCSRLLITIGGEDILLRDRGVWYYAAVKESGFSGELEFIEVEGEGHAFHILEYEKDSALVFIKRLASFVV